MGFLLERGSGTPLLSLVTLLIDSILINSVLIVRMLFNKKRSVTPSQGAACGRQLDTFYGRNA